MSLMVLARRSITFRQMTRGDTTILLVPGRDHIQVVKDLAGVGEVARQMGNNPVRGPQLARVFSGQRYIYGYLPDEIREMRQSVKVWLAEDFAPADCQAFFYVLSPEVIIHGVREQTDEGQQMWRTAQLVLTGSDASAALVNAITDYVLANPGATLCVAVLSQLELYRTLQVALEAYQITPVPFSTLKPLPGVRPLYRHLDHTIIYLTGSLFGLILLISSAAFYFTNWSERARLEGEITQTQQRINSIQINQSTGHIRRPQELLDSMAKSFNQQPSGIVDAAARTAAQFGDLTQIKFSPAEYSPRSGMKAPQQETVDIILNHTLDKLLFAQERRAQHVIANQPWVRTLQRTGTPGDQTQLSIAVQTEGAEKPTPQMLQQAQVSVTLTAEDLRAVSPTAQAEASLTMVSATGAVAPPAALPTQPPPSSTEVPQ